MTDFQSVFSLMDDAKTHIEGLGKNKSLWINKYREATHSGDVTNFYFCIVKETNDILFSTDWAVVTIMMNTIMSENGQCWIYIGIKDHLEKEYHIEKHIPIEDGLEYYNMAKEFSIDIDIVDTQWLHQLNKWLKGDFI